MKKQVKCYEEAGQVEKEGEKPVPKPRRPTTLPVRPQNIDSQNDVSPTSTTIAGSTCTMTTCSSSGETTTTTTKVKTS